MHFFSKWNDTLTTTAFVSCLLNSIFAYSDDITERDQLFHYMESLRNIELDSQTAKLKLDCEMHWYQPFLSVDIGGRDIRRDVVGSAELASHILNYGATIRNNTTQLRLEYQTVINGDYSDYQTSIRELYLTEYISDNILIASIAYGRRKLNDIVFHPFYYNLSTELLHILVGRYHEPMSYGAVDVFVGKADNEEPLIGMHLFIRTVFNTPLDLDAHTLLIGDQAHTSIYGSYDLGQSLIGIQAQCYASLLNLRKDSEHHLSSLIGLLVDNRMQEGWSFDLTYRYLSESMLSNSDWIDGDIFFGPESDQILKNISGALSQVAATLCVAYSDNLFFYGHTSYSVNDSMVFDNDNTTYSGNGRIITSFIEMEYAV
ncbi:hypothetical protein N9N03_01960 [Chlamydiia bacterium]|nr:hypothetical protein [Chlamydiia bacterium]